MRKRKLEQKIEDTIATLKNSHGGEQMKVFQKKLFEYVEEYKKEVGYNEDKNNNRKI